MIKSNVQRAPDNKVIDITGGVKWIGVLDYDIVTFDIVMTTEFGTTYNSYFIDADRKAIVEGVKDKFSDIHTAKLKQVADPEKIEYIILNHTEPDHSGNVSKLIDLCPNATIVGSGNAMRYLADITNRQFNSLVVKDGDVLSLGNKTLRFIAAPNLHWPDSMFTWLEEDKVLFTCDVFGSHYCSPDIFNDFSDDYYKSYSYYFDVIIKPFSRFALKAIAKIKPLEIKYICTGHGPVHNRNLDHIVGLTEQYAKKYTELTAGSETVRILVTYVSAYGYTGRMAERIAEGIREMPGCIPVVKDIENMPLGELDSEITIADALLVGSPTINQNTLLQVYKMFALISPLRDKGKPAGSFGSYGWSGEAPAIIAGNLKNLKLSYYGEPLSFKFSPDNIKNEALREYGKAFAAYAMGCRKQSGE